MKMDGKKEIRGLFLLLVAACALLCGCGQGNTLEKEPSGRLSGSQVPVIKGRFKHVLDAPGQTLTKAPRASWYINDHCFFVEKSGKIHWFGINNPYLKDRNFYGPGTHRYIGHAVADEPFGPWTACEHAMQLAPDDTKRNIGACFVIEKDGAYLMYFCYNYGFGIAKCSD